MKNRIMLSLMLLSSTFLTAQQSKVVSAINALGYYQKDLVLCHVKRHLERIGRLQFFHILNNGSVPIKIKEFVDFIIRDFLHWQAVISPDMCY